MASFGPGDAIWDKNLNTSIVAGCSIFGIRDDKYRYSSFNLLGSIPRSLLRLFLDSKISSQNAPELAPGFFTKIKAAQDWTSDPSPGEQWEPLAPKYKLGYCWTGPADNEGSAAIISSYYSKVKGGMNPIAAWGAANAGTKGVNACAIDTSVTPHQYWYFRTPFSIVGYQVGNPTWTCVTKGGSGW